MAKQLTLTLNEGRSSGRLYGWMHPGNLLTRFTVKGHFPDMEINVAFSSMGRMKSAEAILENSSILFLGQMLYT